MSETRIIELNIPQAVAMMARQKNQLDIWGRGTGKSTLIGMRIRDIVTQMPRSSTSLVGGTYQQILTRTLPSTISSLERLGFRKDLHFVVGKRFPKSWNIPEAYEPPLDYSHYMHFYTGAGFHLISQDRKGSGRGLNTDAVIGDEAALLNYDALQYDVLATNRGGVGRYPGTYLHHSTLFTTTHALTPQGKWIYKYIQEAIKDPKKFFVSMASAKENMKNLGKGWFEQMKQMMTEMLYLIEIENYMPTKVEDGFYSKLDPVKHFYTNYNYTFYDSLGFEFAPSQVNCKGDADLDSSAPLIVSVDWGAAINAMVVCQFNSRSNEFRFLKDFFVKSPKVIRNLFEDEFIPYYAPHGKKEIKFWYDRNGNSRRADSNVTFVQEAAQYLRAAGWKVTLMVKGLDPPHHLKYQLWALLLSEIDTRYPKIRFNQHNCKNLIVSMQNAGARDIKGIHKDKTSEKSKIIPREQATDFSDAGDIPVYWMFKDFLPKKQGGFIDVRFG